MKANEKWLELGRRHPLWNIIRLYSPLTGKNKIKRWEDTLREKRVAQLDINPFLDISDDVVRLFFEYLEEREHLFELAFNNLRTEEEALNFCRRNSIKVHKTTTKNQSHHQSSKSMVASVSSIAISACSAKGLSINANPQGRCAWRHNQQLHVSARNLDGAIPSLVNPTVIWEIKEYWGKTSGGSKMSDALYECHLIGLELREYEERTKQKVHHIVFLDGKVQWGVRKSDLRRFLDIMNQGLIDYLVIGKEVQSEWSKILESIL